MCLSINRRLAGDTSEGWTLHAWVLEAVPQEIILNHRKDKETLLTDSVLSQGFGEGLFYQTRIRVVAVVLILPVLQFGKPVTNAHQIVKCLNQHCGKRLKSTDKAALGSGDTKSKTS